MDNKIQFTDSAKSEINRILLNKSPNTYFRISVQGGGCSGFQYDFSIDKETHDDDLKQENIVIDKNSADLLKGSEIDFVDELIEGV